MTKLNRSIERGLMVLEVVHSSGASSLALLAAQTGLPKPTLLRICATLEQRRWLIRRRSDGAYQLGSAFPQAGGMPELTDRLVAVSKEEIVRLSQQTGLAVDLAASISDGRTEIVDTTRHYKTHGVFPDAVGFRPSPVLSALGLAYLHALPPASRVPVIQALATSLPRAEIAVLPELPKLFKEIGRLGYAIRSPGHWGRAVDYGAQPSAIAVPLISGQTPIGAVNFVWNASAFSIEEVASTHLPRLQHTARAIGRAYAASV